MRIHAVTVLLSLIPMLFSCEVPAPVTPERVGAFSPGTLNSFSRLITDTVGQMPVVVVGKIGRPAPQGALTNEEVEHWAYVVAFENPTGKTFEVIQDSLPALFRDQGGTVWSIQGIGLSGPEAGQQLVPANGSLGYWYAFATRYPGISLDGKPPQDVSVQATNDPAWDIPTQSIVRGARRDDIQSIDAPTFVSEAERQNEAYDWSDEETVIGITVAGESRCYPLDILNWHEIVNDEIGGTPVTITYHPYTSTTRVWQRDPATPSFGVSGLLYEHNMIPYDRRTISRWTQLENRCVNGSRRGETLSILPFVETRFGTWKEIAPNTRILSSNTGYAFFYDEDPLPGFATDERFLSAPISYDDKRLPRKERVYGVIINGDAAVYSKRAFQ